MNEQEEQTAVEETHGLSIQETSKKLSIPENTLRKYLAYFDLAIEKIGRKNYLSEQTVIYLTEIIHLKSNGWSLKQIKEFREQAVNKVSEESPNEASEETSSENIEPSAETPLLTEEKTEENLQEEQQEAPELTVNEAEVESTSTQEFPENVSEAAEATAVEDSTDDVSELDSRELSVNGEEDDATDGEEEQRPPKNYSEERKRVVIRAPFTKDYVNKEIATQAKRASRLYRFLSSRNSPRDSAEIKADLDRRVEFLNGLRYIRDNWLERSSGHKDNSANRHQPKDKDLTTVN